MTYKEQLQTFETKSISSQLQTLLGKIEEAARVHLKDITRSLPNFDIHDFDHATSVLGYMEALTQSKIYEFSPVELFMLHLAPLLHDIGMSLPEWELNCLRAVENRQSKGESKTVLPLFPENASFKECLSYITENKKLIYGDFEEAEEYFFSFPDEDSHIDYLARELHRYQRFRYGNSDKLRNGHEESFDESVLMLRYDYIRETHHLRTEQYVRNLKNLASNDLGGRWAEQVIIDLALVCRLHCESILEVEAISHTAQYYQGNTANLQFIAIMLRVADVMHFSLERAPKSLFAERMIKPEVSREHWIVKLASGINCSITSGDVNGRLSIAYAAFCDEPKIYYFLNEYLNNVDVELSNFERFVSRLRYDLRLSDQLSRYDLSLPKTVLRADIKCDTESFRPAPNLKFTLEQNQIISLLMGVNLYKDKNLAIRELYQNALDACRVIVSKKVQNHGRITFGIGTQKKGGVSKQFLFCRDNGTGMTEEIIEQYLLKIGRSYYKSRDFLSENISSTSFEPISQFGIGLLSCFMIGDQIEIVTKAIDHPPICFEIDGPNEYFYYKKASPVDIETLGNHGSLIKVFLNDESAKDYENRFFENIRGQAYIERNLRHIQTSKDWERNIYPIVSNIVGDYPTSIHVEVLLEGKAVDISRSQIANDLSKFTPGELQVVKEFVKNNQLFPHDGKLDVYLENSHRVATISKQFEVDGIEVSWSMTLPKEAHANVTIPLLNMNPYRYEHFLLIDGISVKDNLNKIGSGYLLNSIQINVIRNKPELSIDRQSIVKVSSELTQAISKIPKLLCKEILLTIQDYLEINSVVDTPEILKLILEYATSKFPEIVPYVFDFYDLPILSKIKFSTLFFDYGTDTSISDYIRGTKIDISRASFDYSSLDSLQRLALYGKVINAQSVVINKNTIEISTSEGLCMPRRNGSEDRFERETYFVRSDNWPESLNEYDFHTGLFPFVPNKLFEHLKFEGEGKRLSPRCGAFSKFGNTLTGVVDILPFQVDSRFGISDIENRFDELPRSRIRRFGKFKDNIWFPELVGHSWENSPRNTKNDFFIFGFVGPVSLTPREKEEIEDYRDREPDYYLGVTTGWSILFLGSTKNHVIVPGFQNRSRMVELIKPSFWKEFHDYTFTWLDGTGVSMF